MQDNVKVLRRHSVNVVLSDRRPDDRKIRAVDTLLHVSQRVLLHDPRRKAQHDYKKSDQ